MKPVDLDLRGGPPRWTRRGPTSAFMTMDEPRRTGPPSRDRVEEPITSTRFGGLVVDPCFEITPIVQKWCQWGDDFFQFFFPEVG